MFWSTCVHYSDLRTLTNVTYVLVFLSVLFFLHLYVNQQCRLVVVVIST